MSDAPEADDAALAAFMEYFRKNYPGPETIIGRPDWHSPKIFRAARHALFTPEALAKSPAVIALVKAAVEAERVRMCHLVCPDLQFMVDSIAEDKAYVAEQYPKLFAKIQARRAEMGTLGGVQVFGEIARDLLAAIREVKS